MDTDSNYKGVDFLDFSKLSDEGAKELFDLLFPDFSYGKTEFPWREYSRINGDIRSPKKSIPADANGSADHQQPTSVIQGTFPETLPLNTIQPYTGPSLDMVTKAQIPPAPFLASGSSRTLPHNISQFAQQPPMTFYSRPPFPVVSSTYPIHGQEMMLHPQQPPNYSEPALYDLQPENDPPPNLDHHHHHQHHKYRNDKQSNFPMRKARKQQYYEHVYSHEDVIPTMMEGSVDTLGTQSALTASVVPFSNHFPTGISTPTGYPVQYIHPGYVPYMPYGGYMQQPGTMIDMTQSTPDVVPFEPPMVVPAPAPPPPPAVVPSPSAAPVSPQLAGSHVVSLEATHQESESEICETDTIVQCEQEVGESEEHLWIPDEVPATASIEETAEQLEKDSGAENEAADQIEDTAMEPIVKDSSSENTSSNYVAEVLPETAAKVELVPKLNTSSTPVVANAWGSGKSWAGLFKTEGTPVPEPKPNKTQEQTDIHSDDEEDVNEDGEVDYLLHKLGKFVQRLKLDFTTRPFQPRGLINRSNWCYINATLQALLVCPALYNMLQQLQDIVCPRNKSSTPIMDSLVEFVKEFTPVNNISKRKEDLNIGTPLEPVCIHKMLTIIKSECIKGRQEDAEEFLSCILNGLHEEMVSLTKATSALNNGTCNGEMETNGRVDCSEEDDEEDSWKVMGSKNKGMVTRSDQLSGSLVKDLFGGQTRSVLTAGSECSAVLQPFFTLQLDIQTNGDSLSESLSQLTVKEVIHGYQCPRSKKEVEACRRTTLEELPPVLILHFKRFIYDDKDGGSKKVLKRTDYPLDLELKTDLLSPEVRKKYIGKQSRSYKLFAVVYHDGKEAVKGHYIADIFYPGCGSWLRCDDRKIEPITEAQVLAFNSPCVPYLLFYSRTDLQQQQQQATAASK